MQTNAAGHPRQRRRTVLRYLAPTLAILIERLQVLPIRELNDTGEIPTGFHLRNRWIGVRHDPVFKRDRIRETAPDNAARDLSEQLGVHRVDEMVRPEGLGLDKPLVVGEDRTQDRLLGLDAMGADSECRRFAGIEPIDIGRHHDAPFGQTHYDSISVMRELIEPAAE